MYKCLKKNSFKDHHGYQLVPIREEDIELIRFWRNAQLEVLRQKAVISFEEQQLYFQQVVWPTLIQQYPSQLLFSFLLNLDCIGYGGLTNIDWESSRAEVSFLVNPMRAENAHNYTCDFMHFLALLCQVAFGDLHLHRLFTETFAFRVEHIHILENFGFKREGVLREHVFKRNGWHDSVMHGFLFEEWGRGK
jgi:RimJ/RimL family protein N-acetyltransferase